MLDSTTSSSPTEPKSDFDSMIAKNTNGTQDNLDSNGITLLHLVKLIVDIKYQNKYGSKFEARRGRGYNITEIDKEIVS